jgi:hypothetical protein
MSVASYKNGMVAGAKPFEDVFKKQEAALTRIADSTKDGIENIDSTVRELVNWMETKDRQEIYGLKDQFDLKSMEDEEKKYLVSSLYSLAARIENPSPFQKEFIRSAKGYLGIRDSQASIDISKIENIGSIDVQKAIMRVFMEYLFLGNEDFSFKEYFADVFADFHVNQKGRNEIEQNIQAIYNAVGSMGFLDKYGFVPEEMEDGKPALKLEKLVIREPI